MKNEDMVYVVTAGCYSDYRIEAIFAIEADAEQYASNLSKHSEERHIQEFALGQELKASLHDVWTCSIMLDTGDITREGCSKKNSKKLNEIAQMHNPMRMWIESCKSMEHACKLAAEVRQRWLLECANTER